MTPTPPYGDIPPDPVCERVRADIIDTLEFVTKENGWRQDLEVHGRKQGEEPSPKHGLAIVFQDDPALAEGQDQQSHSWEQIFAVLFYVEQSNTEDDVDIDTLVNRVRSDIESALCQATTAQRNGLAINTIPAGFLNFESVDGALAGGVVLVKVLYAHGYGDPFTSATQ